MAEAQQRIGEFYAEVVLPALAARLDAAFPEFGWRRDARGWVASNQEMTHRVLGVRADRVVAHGDAPPGFLVHGGPTVLWTAYVNGGDVPRGDAFRSVVRELAGRAGVDPSPIERAQPRDRRSELLNDFFRLCRGELHGQARRSRSCIPPEPRLPRRGDRPGRPRGRSSGAVHEERPRSGRLLRARDRAVRRARGRPLAREALRSLARRARTNRNVLGSRRFKTPIPRRVTSTSAEQAAQTLPPYGLSEVLRLPSDGPTRGRACRGSDRRASPPRAAATRTSPRSAVPACPPRRSPGLAGIGIESVVLAFDNDAAGRDGAARAVRDVSRADQRAGASRRRAEAARATPRTQTALCVSTGWRDSATWSMGPPARSPGTRSSSRATRHRTIQLSSAAKPSVVPAAGSARCRHGSRSSRRTRLATSRIGAATREWLWTHLPRPILG